MHENRINTGALFKNDRKDEGVNRPDYTGI